MNKLQLLHHIVRPTLIEIPRGLTEESELAIMMIIAHESKRGEYVRQVGAGPALGLIQMEPATHDDVWKHGDSVWENARNMDIIDVYDYNVKIHPDSSRLVYDLRYNVFMARQRLFMKSEALPIGDKLKMSRYLKKHWNSAQGRATFDSYYKDYKKWV